MRRRTADTARNGPRAAGPGIGRRLAAAVAVCLLCGCARLPYTTKVLHEDKHVVVKLEQEVDGTRYGHPVSLTPEEMRAVLRGLSLRERKGIPARWLSDEAPPVRAFREEEAQSLAGHLADALRQAGPRERVAWQVFGPGFNPPYEREETSGWLAVRGEFLHLTIGYFHAQNPSTRFSHYDWYYPTPPFPPGEYDVFFEPSRFWSEDPETGERGLEFQAFLTSARNPGPAAAPGGSGGR